MTIEPPNADWITQITEGRRRLTDELANVSAVRDEDSNDDHIAALADALSAALDLLDQVGGFGGIEAERMRGEALG